MEERIAEAPDDIETRRVVADWLIERGDPRGELISAHLAREQGNTDVSPVISQLEATILGRWATPPSGVTLEIRWARGYWEMLTFATRDDSLARLLPDLLADPSARFLRELVIGEAGVKYGSYDTHLFERLPATLVRVHLGKRILSSNSTYMTWTRATLPPNVRELTFECLVRDLDGLPQHLERLGFREYFTNADAIRRVFAARPFPALRELELAVDDSYWSDGAGAVLDGTRQAALRHLIVHESGHWIVNAIAKSGILRQLDVLELANGRIEDETAETLAVCPDLDHLQTLDLTGNRISDRVLAKFRGRPFALRGDRQRYDQAGE